MTDEFEPDDTQAGPEPEAAATGLSSLPRWLQIGLGLVGVILILALVWPRLRDRASTQPASPGVALTGLEQAAAADPGNEALQYQVAGAYYQAQRFNDAWTRFRAVEAYRVAAENRPEIAAAEQAVQANPSSREAHFKLGTAWAQAQLLAPAEIAFQQAIALDSQCVDAFANLGVVYYQMGRLPEALSVYDAALSVNPDDADVHYNKGVVYVQQAVQTSPPDEALLDQGMREFQSALEINPDLAQAHFSLGVVHNVRGRTSEAIAEFKRFLELDPGTDPEATNTAKTYLMQLEQ